MPLVIREPTCHKDKFDLRNHAFLYRNCLFSPSYRIIIEHAMLSNLWWHCRIFSYVLLVVSQLQNSFLQWIEFVGTFAHFDRCTVAKICEGGLWNLLDCRDGKGGLRTFRLSRWMLWVMGYIGKSPNIFNGHLNGEVHGKMVDSPLPR